MGYSVSHLTQPEALKKLAEFRDLMQKRAQHVTLSKFTTDFLAYAEANYRPGTVSLYMTSPRSVCQ